MTAPTERARPRSTIKQGPEEADGRRGGTGTDDESLVPDAGKKVAGAVAVSGPAPTPNPPLRQGGLQIDGFGLPVNGVARTRVLNDLGLADPAAGGGEWKDTQAAAARELTEKHYG